MTVQGGGVVQTTGGGDSVGVWQGATGALTVTGAGSTWTSAGSLDIGENGTGTLYVENDAKLNAAYLDTGVNYGQQTLADGSGTTYIESGGVVTTTGDYQEIGSDATGQSDDVIEGATGAVTVTGAGSEWNAENGEISIGDAGSKSGSLTISDDGKVVSTNPLYIGDEWNGADGSLRHADHRERRLRDDWRLLERDRRHQRRRAEVDRSCYGRRLLLDRRRGHHQREQRPRRDVWEERSTSNAGLALKAARFKWIPRAPSRTATPAAPRWASLLSIPIRTSNSNLWAEGTIEADVVDNGKIYSNEFMARARW